MTPDSRLPTHDFLMYRCLELAKQGIGCVAPNPMVGAMLVHNNRIIGEGYHRKFGEAHAEVNCINSVKEEDRKLISESTLYVSLEPCSHFGKTPPCTDLIIKNKIKKLIIGCRDPNKEVKGIEKLEAAGVEVETGILEKECKELNKRFITFHTELRPYIILKWAQTADGFMAPPPPSVAEGLPKAKPEGKASPFGRHRLAEGDANPSEGGALEASKDKKYFAQSDSKVPPCGGFRGASRLLISNEYSNRLVHKWRSEEAAILIGTNTALLDDPELTTRLWPGPSPMRLVVDMDLKLPSSLKIFNNTSPAIIFNTKVHSKESEWAAPSPSEISEQSERKERSSGVRSLYWQVTEDVNLLHQILNALYHLKIQSVLVEGGAKLLQSFIDENMWDEVRVIKNEELIIKNGLNAPFLESAEKIFEQKLFSDKIEIYKPKHS